MFFFAFGGLLNSAIVMYIYGPMCLHYFFLLRRIVFLPEAIFEFRYAHCFNKYLNKAKRKSLPDGAFMKGNGGRGSDRGVFLKALIINSSRLFELARN